LSLRRSRGGRTRSAGYATAIDRLDEFRGAIPDPRHPAVRLLDETLADLS
jgi:hypothetical protein